MIGKYGETVNLSLLLTVTGAPTILNVFTRAGVSRPLQSYETLMIDSIVTNPPSGVTALDFLNANATTTTTANLVLSLSASTPEFHDDGEGLSWPQGVTPWVLMTGATGNTRITGIGRIYQTTQPARQNWQAPLNGGTVAGNAG